MDFMELICYGLVFLVWGFLGFFGGFGFWFLVCFCFGPHPAVLGDKDGSQRSQETRMEASAQGAKDALQPFQLPDLPNL